MWWFIAIVVVGLVIYVINKDHKSYVETHLTKFGGMQGKFGQVIDYLKAGGLVVKKITADSVILSSSSMLWTLDYVEDTLEVLMKGNIPLYGNVRKKWIFPDGYPQDKIIEEIENYIDWQFHQFKKNI